MIPIQKFTIEMCECRGHEDPRREMKPFFYRTEDGEIRCEACDELHAAVGYTDPTEYHVELTIIHRLRDYTDRVYKEVLFAEEADE